MPSGCRLSASKRFASLGPLRKKGGEMTEDQRYQPGFANHFSTEAIPGALPIGRNSPQRPPYGLVAELLSGSAFTAKRHENLRSWLYRIQPSVVQGRYEPITLHKSLFLSAPLELRHITPQQLRWDPHPEPQEAESFLQSITTLAANGDAGMRLGSAIHLFHFNKSMDDDFFINADGEMLIVPQSHALEAITEFGTIQVAPLEILVVPRGVKFQINLVDKSCRGYILENYGHPFVLPQLGPIGSNGLANPRDFLYPKAQFFDKSGSYSLVTKFSGAFFKTSLHHHPCDVVAWHGNLSPYKYSLERFNTINTVSFDHPDPSIFTVLTSPSDHEGLANVDFVIFPPRWMVAEDTFRPPYYHRNVMSEYMGLIKGVYDAKPSGGFEPGGGSLHSCMSPHGPEAEVLKQGTNAILKPQFQKDTMAFMFESSYIYRPTRFAIEGGTLQPDYSDCWQGIEKSFDREQI